MLRVLDIDSDIVEVITGEVGYKFDFIGSINMQAINEWYNLLLTRLSMEKVMKSSAIIDTIIVADSIRKKRDKPLGDSKGKIVSLSDYYEDINVFSIYVIVDQTKISDEFSFNNLMPLILDCELIEDLFDANGEYIGSDRDISEYNKF